MEFGVRLLLLLIGSVILVGIAWDILRGRTHSKRQEKKEIQNRICLDDAEEVELEPFREDLESLNEHSFDMDIAIEDDIENTVSYSSKGKPEKLVVEQIIVFYVMAKSQTVFKGTALIEALQTMHLKYGDMQIFHYYEHLDGREKKLFSVASAVEPGNFDLTNLKNFSTPGIILFFTVKNFNQTMAIFELMLKTAKELAEHLQGELKDDQRCLLTAHRIEQYRERIRAMKVSRQETYLNSI